MLRRTAIFISLCFIGEACWPFDGATKAKDGHGGTNTDPSKIDCTGPRSMRYIYIDMGVNWANTLRLYRDYGFCGGVDEKWEVYGFEAMPLIVPYANSFVQWLNGVGGKPPMELPPTGSDHELFHFAKKHKCDKVPPLTTDNTCHAG